MLEFEFFQTAKTENLLSSYLLLFNFFYNFRVDEGSVFFLLFESVYACFILAIAIIEVCRCVIILLCATNFAFV